MHYSVAVFHEDGQKIEEILAPYDENLESEFEEVVWLTIDQQLEIFDYEHPYEAEIPMEERLRIVREFMHADKIDEAGNILTMANPKAKWDWWVIGGRWDGLLETENGWLSHSQIKDLKSKDFVTYAVITSDGEWFESESVWLPGEENVWECEYYSRFLKDADPELIVTIVDMHI